MSKQLLQPLTLVLLVSAGSALVVSGYVGSLREPLPVGLERVAPCAQPLLLERREVAPSGWSAPCERPEPCAEARSDRPAFAPRGRI